MPVSRQKRTEVLRRQQLVGDLQAGNHERAHDVVAFAAWLQCNPVPRGAQLSIDMLTDALVDQALRSVLWKAMTREEFQILLPLLSSFLEGEDSSELGREINFMVR